MHVVEIKNKPLPDTLTPAQALNGQRGTWFHDREAAGVYYCVVDVGDSHERQHGLMCLNTCITYTANGFSPDRRFVRIDPGTQFKITI